MSFVDIRLAGSTTREPKAGLVADMTQSLLERLGRSLAAVHMNIADSFLKPTQEDASAYGRG